MQKIGSLLLISLCIVLKVSSALAQCNRTVFIEFTSLNLVVGCDFGDTDGMDPTMDITYGNNSSSYIATYRNIAPQGPIQDWALTSDPECSWTREFTLGTFPEGQTSENVQVEIYEKDINFFNPVCSGYIPIIDTNYGTGTHTFDFSQPSGTIDVGSCISFNYELTYTLDGNTLITLDDPICPESFIEINNNIYDTNKRTGTETVLGLNGACDTIYTIDLSVYNPEPLMITGPDSICSGTSYTLQANAGYTQYQWDTGADTQELTLSEAGTSSLVVMTTDGCMVEDSIKIDTLITTPPVIEGNPYFCIEDSTQLTVTSDYNDITWRTGETTSAIFINATGDYSVTTTDMNGCASSSTISVDEIPKPSITFEGNTYFCDGDSTAVSVMEDYTNYRWSNNETTKSVVFDEARIYVVTVTDTAGCTNSTQLAITRVPLPIPTVIGELNVCPGETAVISTSQNFADYAWSTGEMTPEIEVPQGTYMLTVTDNLNGCSGSTSIIVTEQDAYMPIITGSETICIGSENTLGTLESYEAYSWSTGETTTTINVSQADVYTLTVTDINGCIGTNSLTTQISTSLSFSIDGETTICKGDMTVLSLPANFTYLWNNGEITPSINVTEADTYTVTATDLNGCTGSSSIDVIVTPLNITMRDSLTCDPSLVGVYTIPIPNVQGCDDILITTITLGEDRDCKVVDGLGIYSESCFGARDGYINIRLQEGVAFPVGWALSKANGKLIESGTTDTIQTQTSKILEPGDYNLMTTDADGRMEMRTFDVGTYQTNYSVSPEVVMNAGDSTLLNMTIDLDTSRLSYYYWSDGDTRLCPDNCYEVMVAPDCSKVYTAQFARTNEFCTYKDSTQVLILKSVDLYAPNIFDPSMSDINGEFKLLGPGADRLSSLNIYDRWGNLVFSTDDGQVGWDGRYGNNDAAAGVYIYSAKVTQVDGTIVMLEGHFMMTR